MQESKKRMFRNQGKNEDQMCGSFDLHARPATIFANPNKDKIRDQEKELTKITCAEARIFTHGQRRLRQPQFH